MLIRLQGIAATTRETVNDAGFRERFAPHAWGRWLQSSQAAELPIWINHDERFQLKLAKPVQFNSTGACLRVEIAALRTPLARNVELAVRHGWLPGLSFGYRIMKSEFDTDRAGLIRIVQRIEPTELSIVDWPRNRDCWIHLESGVSFPAARRPKVQPESKAERDRLRAFLCEIGYRDTEPVVQPRPAPRRPVRVTSTAPAKKRPSAPAKPTATPRPIAPAGVVVAVLGQSGVTLVSKTEYDRRLYSQPIDAGKVRRQLEAVKALRGSGAFPFL